MVKYEQEAFYTYCQAQSWVMDDKMKIQTQNLESLDPKLTK